jgi:hypothetical protein
LYSMDNSLDELVVMRDHSTGLSDCIFRLIQYRVRSILGICHDDSLLRSDSDYSQGEQANKEEVQE